MKVSLYSLENVPTVWLFCCCRLNQLQEKKELCLQQLAVPSQHALHEVEVCVCVFVCMCLFVCVCVCVFVCVCVCVRV